MHKSFHPRLILVILVLSTAGLACQTVVDGFVQETSTSNLDLVPEQTTAQILATPTFTPAHTFLPSPTLSQTVTPTEEVATPTFNSFAQSNVAAQERGGVVVEIAWILVGDRQGLEQELPDDLMFNSEMLADKPVLVWLVFNIRNRSGKSFHLHPRNGSVIVNNETIDLSEYKSYTSVDENFDGAYVPGEKVLGGGVWFGIEHSEVADINEIIVRMHGPHFFEEDVYAKEYYIVLDLSNHRYDDLPEYLQ